MAQKHLRLGILTPSSNTALEPLTYAILHSINAANPTLRITAHFARLPVTKISLEPSVLSQFDPSAFLPAAQLLATASIDVIGWSGTSAGWLGFEHDEELCKLIEEETGIKATTSTLGLNRALESVGKKRLGLVTPYTDDVQQAIIKNYKAAGYECGGELERHVGVQTNVDIEKITREQLRSMVGEVVEKGGAEVVSTFCTNLLAADVVEKWEKGIGVMVLDSVATVVWDCLRMLGVDMRGLEGWGRMFRDLK